MAVAALVTVWADSLQFDTTTYASSRQYLTFTEARARRAGPYAMLLPEIGAASVATADLDHGRVLAKLVQGQASHPIARPFSYPLLGLPRGVYYVWVDTATAGLTYDPARPGQHLRAVFVDSATGNSVLTLALYRVASATPLCALARILSPRPGAADDYICFTCDSGWCCSDET